MSWLGFAYIGDRGVTGGLYYLSLLMIAGFAAAGIRCLIQNSSHQFPILRRQLLHLHTLARLENQASLTRALIYLHNVVYNHHQEVAVRLGCSFS